MHDHDVVAGTITLLLLLYTDDYYSGPIELIDGLLDVTKKAILAQIEWTDEFQVTKLSHSSTSSSISIAVAVLAAADVLPGLHGVIW